MSKNRRTGSAKKPGTKKRGISWKLLFCFAFLSFLIMDGYRSIRGFERWRRNRAIKQGYVQAVERLRLEQKQLEEEIRKLESNPLAQERVAREMGYIKPGETVYKLGRKPHDAGSKPTD